MWRGRGHLGARLKTGKIMNHSEIKKSTEERMKRSLEALSNGLAKIRTGRAHTGLLDHITVDYYGSEVPVSQVANITIVDARTLSVQVWEKHMAEVVDKAIRDRKSTRLNSSHVAISYAVFCLK